ncbi:MAG: hypothetical protein PUB21_08100 [Bacteroidales bacterium]|nr:hypothetical protein [Bacteroidales bacterium]
MKKIALDIDQMKHLQSLGIDTSNASMCWVNHYEEPALSYELHIYIDFFKKNPQKWIIPAFTLQDILELMEGITYERSGFPLSLITYDYTTKTWNMGLRNPIGLENPKVESPSLLDTAYNMLVWMIENGLFQKSGKN